MQTGTGSDLAIAKSMAKNRAQLHGRQCVAVVQEAKCTCGKTRKPPNCDGSHAKKSR